jgi:hypothetical protein
MPGQWWEQDALADQPAPTQGVIYGRPKQPTPLELAREQRAQASEARADAAAIRAEEASDRAAAREVRQQQIDARKLTQTDKLTEGEQKATNFFTSSLGAEREWQTLLSNPDLAEGTQPHGLGGDAARAILPAGVVNSWTSSARQRAEQAKLNFIRASLRLESGAAISNSEYERQDRAFFPQTGDGPDVIAQKARARAELIEGFRIGSGRGAEQVPADIRDFYQSYSRERTGAPQPPGEVRFNDEMPERSANSYRFTPEQEAAFSALAQSGANEEQLAALAQRFGGNSDPENLRRIVEYYRNPANRETPTNVDYSRVDEVRPIDPGDGRAGAVVRGIANAGSLGFVNRIGALADTVSGGTYADNLDRRRGYDAYDEENYGGSRIAGQLVGGAALPIRGPATARNLAVQGAAYGGVAGLGNSYGSSLDRLAAAGTGAALGAGFGYAGGRASEWLAGRGGPPPNTPGQDVYQAGQRIGVDVMPADVGGPMTRRFTAGAAQSPISAGSIVRGGERVIAQSQAARDRTAAAVGNVADPYAAGEMAQRGATNYIARSRNAVGDLYDAARSQAGDARPTPQRSLDTLDRNLRELAETPETSRPVTAALGRLGDDLRNPDGLSIDALRRLRTNVRGLAQTDELRGTDFQRRAGQVLDSISEDIAAGLTPEARAAFTRADQAHRQRVETIDEVLKPIIGGRGERAFAPERVYSNIVNATRSDSGRLRRFIESLPEEDASSVRATIIGQLGRATDGTQNAAGDAFSLNAFLTQWNRMTPRAKQTLFQGETRAALDDLAMVAQGSRQASQYANRSNTGSSVIANALTSAGAVASYFQPAILAGFALNYGAGRLLASPRFARWLARPVNTPEQAATAVRRLSAIAAREPAIANDLLPIQRALQESLPRAAAQGKEQDRR